MKTWVKLTATVASLSFSLLPLLPAQAASSEALTRIAAATAEDNSTPVGFMIKYRPGVTTLARNGQPTGENAAAVDLTNSRSIGNGWQAVSFAGEVSELDAQRALARLSADPRVEAVAMDNFIHAAGFVGLGSGASAAIKPASAVRSLKAAGTYSVEAPTTAQIKLTWSAPKSLFGGKVVGYRIEKSTNNKIFSAVRTNTRSTDTTFIVTSGLKVGTKYYFRVKALTKSGSTTKIGAASASVKAVAVILPKSPEMISPTVAINTANVSWRALSKADAGGAAVTYVATAKATDEATVSCTTTSTSCSLSLVADVTYAISVVAKNSAGSSLDAGTPLVAQDARFGEQWSLNGNYGVKAGLAWKKTMGSKSAIVAVIDTGITAHPDLDGRTVPGYDFISDVWNSKDGDGRDSDPSDAGDAVTENGQFYKSSWHGTHVSGIIAGRSDAVGITGVAPNSRVLPVRVLGAYGGSSSDIVAGMAWAIGDPVDGVPTNPNPAKVLNLSLGSDSYVPCDFATQSVIDSALSKNITVAIAAGNAHTDVANSYPANCQGVIAVAASNIEGNISSYSNYGTGITIAAPGGDNGNGILSTINTGGDTPFQPGYDSMMGTSMATPLLAGVVSLMYSLKPTITPLEVKTILVETMIPFSTSSVCTIGTLVCGPGIVDANAALEAVKASIAPAKK